MKKILFSILACMSLCAHAEQATIDDKIVHNDTDITLTINGVECSPDTINADDVAEGDDIIYNANTGYVDDQTSGVQFYCN